MVPSGQQVPSPQDISSMKHRMSHLLGGMQFEPSGQHPPSGHSKVQWSCLVTNDDFLIFDILRISISLFFIDGIAEVMMLKNTTVITSIKMRFFMLTFLMISLSFGNNGNLRHIYKWNFMYYVFDLSMKYR